MKKHYRATPEGADEYFSDLERKYENAFKELEDANREARESMNEELIEEIYF